MVAPLLARVSTHHWPLSSAPETQNLDHRRISGGLYVSMLHDDFENLHFAYEMGLEYDGADYEHGNRIMAGLLRELSHGNGRHEDATRLFPQLVSTVADDHLMYGRSLFELFADSDPEGPGARLGVLPGWSLKHRGGVTLQATPNVGDLEWRPLPASALIEFGLPGGLGKELYRTRERLHILGAHWPQDHALLANSRSTGYDFGRHQRLLNQMAARATKSIGWDGRDLFVDRATDSYRMYRKLRFVRTWLTIVSATIKTLNTVCKHPAIGGGVPLEVRVTGLPTKEDVEHSMAAVMNGTEPLDDIFKRILHPRHA